MDNNGSEDDTPDDYRVHLAQFPQSTLDFACSGSYKLQQTFINEWADFLSVSFGSSKEQNQA